MSAGRLAFVIRAGVLLLLGASLAGCSGHARAASRRVVMLAHSYDPPALTVAPGDTVEWVDHDLVPHTATARNGRWDSGVLAPEQSWRHVFAAGDSATYSCLIHPEMLGTVVVK